MDAQHRALFAAANALLATADVRDDPDLFLRGLTFLGRYCRWHFATEERAMARRDYPLLEQHRRGHHALSARIEDLWRRSESAGPTDDLRMRLHRLVTDWVSVHVEVMDRDFVRFARGVDGAVADPAGEGADALVPEPPGEGEADLADTARQARNEVPEGILREHIRARW